MCNVCSKQFKGWLKSFTRTEIILSLLEAVFLAIFIGFLIFLIFHLLACSKRNIENEPITDNTLNTIEISSTIKDITKTYESSETTTLKPTKAITIPEISATVNPDIKCTWEVSQKTDGNIQYFYPVTAINVTKSVFEVSKHVTEKEITPNFPNDDTDFTIINSNTDLDIMSDGDGEEATESIKKHVLALVKLKPPKDITFGCILTVVNDFWALTAASCLEAIEEVGVLDNFVMMEGYGNDYSKSYAVSDVRIHPLYQGANRSYDLAALKSEDSLLKDLTAVELPELLDYFLLTLGERFTVLGYGQFRTIDKGPSSNSLRQTYVYNLSGRQCPVPSDTWGLRTLKPGEPIVHSPCGTAPLCAGVLFNRGNPCNYCSGTPLMYGSVLYGVMSDNQQCGVSCEPQIYVNIAVVRDWLDAVLNK